MYQIKQTDVFFKWLLNLKDLKGRFAVIRRIKRLKDGNFGDRKSINNSLSELRIFTGAGYRVFYTVRGEDVIILLVGGDKSTQRADIEKANEILERIERGEVDYREF